MDCVHDKLDVPEKKRPHNTKPKRQELGMGGEVGIKQKLPTPSAPEFCQRLLFPWRLPVQKQSDRLGGVFRFDVEQEPAIRGYIVLLPLYRNNAAR